jgi:uncharacterized membrane protein (UPF0127 family)
VNAYFATEPVVAGALVVLAVVWLALAPHARADSPSPGFARAPLFIDTARGATLRFDVEVATTGAQRSHGLMFRTELGLDAGMLFVWEREDIVGMWMKNTFIPLDMLFIARDGRIAHIAANTTPKSLKIVSSRWPVRTALELPGGSAARLGIAPGDLVRSEALPRAP